MNASFGIDHPLIATHDINALRARLMSIGFNMTAIGNHPWGTSTSLAMFEGCLIEIMGIYDDTLLDKVPAGDFRFGRHVYEHLQLREGVALTALHSSDSLSDAAYAESLGFALAGHLEFGRDVTLPDGQSGRTKTTLALMPDLQWPRLSFFLCQQHRPDLIYVPDWLQHPNTVYGIAGITILAEVDVQVALKEKLVSLYTNAEVIEGGFQIPTANGTMRIQTKKSIESEMGALPEEIRIEDGPCIVALDLKFRDESRLHQYLTSSESPFSESGNVYRLNDPERWGNMLLQFSKH